jgi:hypothetical protein
MTMSSLRCQSRGNIIKQETCARRVAEGLIQQMEKKHVPGLTGVPNKGVAGGHATRSEVPIEGLPRSTPHFILARFLSKQNIPR